MESRTTVFLTYPFLIVFDFLDIRVYGRDEIVNEDQFSDDQIAAIQRFINRLCEIIADEIINGNLSYVQFQENRD